MFAVRIPILERRLRLRLLPANLSYPQFPVLLGPHLLLLVSKKSLYELA
jgi:hypothetical protein